MTKIAVFGAGAIGCYVGGRLAAGGANVVLIGRRRVMDELAGGLHLTDLDGLDVTVQVPVATDAEAARDADVVLVTVKSAATDEAGRALAPIVKDGAATVSVQNGVRNADVLRAAMPGKRVLAGMVMYNVARQAPGRYHRGTIGSLMVEADAAIEPLLEACRAAKLAIEPRDDMPAVQWGKLVMNLNNAINALSNVPLATELADRDFRRCLAATQREAFIMLGHAKQPVARLTAIPPRLMPRLLPMPDWLFHRLAKRVVAIDPHARSSMWDDLEAKRPTEVDYMQGEVVALAERHGRIAPVNAALQRLVHDAEAGGKRDFTGHELFDRLRVAWSAPGQ
jgi:2-dehydropantoate 2-reductase